MSIKATLTTLILGTTTLATAQPVPQPTYDDRNYDRQNDRGERVRRRPVTLAHNLVLGGRASRPAFVALNPRHGIVRLRLNLDNGRAFIDSILVTYADGRRASMPIQQLISPQNPSLTITLPAYGASGVYINSSPMRSARGAGYYRRTAATVTVVGLRR